MINFIFYYKLESELQLEGSLHQLAWKDPISEGGRVGGGGREILVFSKAFTPTLYFKVAFCLMNTGEGIFP